MEETELENTDNDAERMICMDCDNNEEEILHVNSINHLIKECHCEYNIHEKCLHEWLKNTPACTICKNSLY